MDWLQRLGATVHPFAPSNGDCRIDAPLLLRHTNRSVDPLGKGFRDAVIDNLPAAVFCKDASDAFRFVLWNKRQEEITGIRREDALGKTDYDIFPSWAANQFRRVDEYVMLTGDTLDIPEEEVDTGGSSGSSFWLHTVKVPITDPTSGRSLLLGISEDITERKHLDLSLTRTSEELKETQLQLIQAEKLESIGRLAAGVAHEVKNPLALILMGVEYLDGGIDPEDANLPIIIKEMREAVSRADNIIRGLVDFSSSRQLDLKLQDVRPILDHALLLVRHEITRGSIQMNTHYAPDLPQAVVDSSKFEQVLVNLLINAVHALQDVASPMLWIRAYAEQLHDIPPDLGSRTAERLRSGDYVVTVVIEDNGSGIPEEKLTKIFDPFFTTKPTGIGTGLGLSVVRNIIELHKGRIEIANRAEGGVRATIQLRTQASSGT